MPRACGWVLFVRGPAIILQLRSLKGKVAVVAMVGMYRTGKSYLLNQIAGRDSAFQVQL